MYKISLAIAALVLLDTSSASYLSVGKREAIRESPAPEASRVAPAHSSSYFTATETLVASTTSTLSFPVVSPALLVKKKKCKHTAFDYDSSLKAPKGSRSAVEIFPSASTLYPETYQVTPVPNSGVTATTATGRSRMLVMAVSDRIMFNGYEELQLNSASAKATPVPYSLANSQVGHLNADAGVKEYILAA